MSCYIFAHFTKKNTVSLFYLQRFAVCWDRSSNTFHHCHLLTWQGKTCAILSICWDMYLLSLSLLLLTLLLSFLLFLSLLAQRGTLTFACPESII